MNKDERWKDGTPYEGHVMNERDTLFTFKQGVWCATGNSLRGLTMFGLVSLNHQAWEVYGPVTDLITLSVKKRSTEWRIIGSVARTFGKEMDTPRGKRWVIPLKFVNAYDWEGNHKGIARKTDLETL